MRRAKNIIVCIEFIITDCEKHVVLHVQEVTERLSTSYIHTNIKRIVIHMYTIHINMCCTCTFYKQTYGTHAYCTYKHVVQMHTVHTNV